MFGFMMIYNFMFMFGFMMSYDIDKNVLKTEKIWNILIPGVLDQEYTTCIEL